ncbi:hypothetical protein LTR56_023190 [Elasticomyces elasticus]|nr:hypothetical protein LTR56_023190 [Elasticomyces elasticus]KAK3622849.1 hypothetical protein LTR22_024637 [Elasticomyces elasticus]KAK4893669.1 hypothetical protein LTR49_028469 [Elasticomyces elasticus]KAK5736175.1 hypothetical protein LTS12_026256 [Elasticomyces elasticus]
MPMNEVYIGGSAPNMLIDAQDTGKITARLIEDARATGKRNDSRDNLPSVLGINEIRDEDATLTLESGRKRRRQSPGEMSNKVLLAVALYTIITYVHVDSTPEYAAYLSYDSAKEL